MINSAFVNALPEGLVFAPIYKQGAKMISGKAATGKNPLEESYDRDFGASDVRLALNRNPDLQAIGLFCGPRGNGVVILDVDNNLKKHLKVWDKTLVGAPKIVSTKPNAAKYIFRVPEALWGEVEGHGLREEENGDYEVLWGKRQGLIFGAYPGHKSGAPAGEYTFEGDLNSIPVVPDWLLAEMKQPPVMRHSRRLLDFSDRTNDEKAQIIQECLSVISHRGVGSREHWIRVGLAIHSTLDTDLGLMLWSVWSAEDPDFSNEWADSDDRHTPCSAAWYSFRHEGKWTKGPVGLGSLIYMADREDRDRTRFSKETADIVKAAEEKRIQEIRTTTLPFSEVIARGQKALKLSNPAERNYTLNSLALQAGYRDQVSLEQVLVDQMIYDKQKGIISIEELMAINIERNYLIPDVLPKPSVVLVYGTGGDGKSMACWTLAKHVATGSPFVVKGKLVPVEKGPVMILNGDQSLVQLKEQLQEVDFPSNKETMVQNDWQLQYYAQFIDLMETYQPKLVVIDSLIGCSGGKAFDENKSDFAQPLSWLARNNGSAFPETTILVIHHANKNGGIRGTSAIQAAVDETWELTKPSDEQISKFGSHSRVITVGKSRVTGRQGTQLLMQMQDDLSFKISDFSPEVDTTNTSPTSVIDRVLQKIREATEKKETISTNDLICDPHLTGSPAAIRKSLQRLVKKGLIRTNNENNTLQNTYTAVLACGGLENVVPSGTLSSAGTGSKVGQVSGTKG